MMNTFRTKLNKRRDELFRKSDGVPTDEWQFVPFNKSVYSGGSGAPHTNNSASNNEAQNNLRPWVLKRGSWHDGVQPPPVPRHSERLTAREGIDFYPGSVPQWYGGLEPMYLSTCDGYPLSVPSGPPPPILAECLTADDGMLYRRPIGGAKAKRPVSAGQVGDLVRQRNNIKLDQPGSSAFDFPRQNKTRNAKTGMNSPHLGDMARRDVIKEDVTPPVPPHTNLKNVKAVLNCPNYKVCLQTNITANEARKPIVANNKPPSKPSNSASEAASKKQHVKNHSRAPSKSVSNKGLVPETDYRQEDRSSPSPEYSLPINSTYSSSVESTPPPIPVHKDQLFSPSTTKLPPLPVDMYPRGEDPPLTPPPGWASSIRSTIQSTINKIRGQPPSIIPPPVPDHKFIPHGQTRGEDQPPLIPPHKMHANGEDKPPSIPPHTNIRVSKPFIPPHGKNSGQPNPSEVRKSVPHGRRYEDEVDVKIPSDKQQHKEKRHSRAKSNVESPSKFVKEEIKNKRIDTPRIKNGHGARRKSSILKCDENEELPPPPPPHAIPLVHSISLPLGPLPPTPDSGKIYSSSVQLSTENHFDRDLPPPPIFSGSDESNSIPGTSNGSSVFNYGFYPEIVTGDSVNKPNGFAERSTDPPILSYGFNPEIVTGGRINKPDGIAGKPTDPSLLSYGSNPDVVTGALATGTASDSSEPPVKPAIRKSFSRRSVQQQPVYQNLDQSLADQYHDDEGDISLMRLGNYSSRSISGSCKSLTDDSTESVLSTSSQSSNSSGLGSRQESQSSSRSPWLVTSNTEDDQLSMSLFSHQLSESLSECSTVPLVRPMSLTTSESLEDSSEIAFDIISGQKDFALDNNQSIENPASERKNNNAQFSRNLLDGLNKLNDFQEIVHTNGDIELIKIIEEPESFENGDGCPPMLNDYDELRSASPIFKYDNFDPNDFYFENSNCSTIYYGDTMTKNNCFPVSSSPLSPVSLSKLFCRRSGEYDFESCSSGSLSRFLSHSDIAKGDVTPELVIFSDSSYSLSSVDSLEEPTSPSNPKNLMEMSNAMRFDCIPRSSRHTFDEIIQSRLRGLGNHKMSRPSSLMVLPKVKTSHLKMKRPLSLFSALNIDRLDNLQEVITSLLSSSNSSGN